MYDLSSRGDQTRSHTGIFANTDAKEVAFPERKFCRSIRVSVYQLNQDPKCSFVVLAVEG